MTRDVRCHSGSTKERRPSRVLYELARHIYTVWKKLLVLHKAKQPDIDFWCRQCWLHVEQLDHSCELQVTMGWSFDFGNKCEFGNAYLEVHMKCFVWNELSYPLNPEIGFTSGFYVNWDSQVLGCSVLGTLFTTYILSMCMHLLTRVHSTVVMIQVVAISLHSYPPHLFSASVCV